MIAADLAVRRIGLLATLAGPAPRTGAAMRDLGLARDAAIAVAGGRVAWVGPDAGFDAAVVLRPGAETLDAGGAAVVPGLVDAHTHLAFAGDRDDEIRRRLAGASYQEIAAEGGGIVRTVEATRAASVEELAGPRRLAPRRDAALRHHHGRGEERLRARDRGGDPEPRGHPPRRRRATPSPSCRRSSARTRCRASTAGTGPATWTSSSRR